MAALNDFCKFDLFSDDCLLFIIDEQEKLVPALLEGERMVEKTTLLLHACRELEIPVFKTEQYPKGLGRTVPAVAELCQALQSSDYEKVDFNAISNEIRSKLRVSGRQRILVTGGETHICVLQTVRALLKQGYFVFVVADAVASRRALDHQVGLEQMREMGAVITSTEAVIFDLLKQAGTPAFKILSKLIK